MEYLLREWYESFHKGRIGRYMELAEEARSFSEEYFQGLYKRKLEAWLDWLAKNAMEEHWEDGSYSDSKRRAAFASNFQAKLGTLERLLPAELRAEIADLRVLALDVVSPEAAEVLERFCGECMRRNEEITKIRERNRALFLWKHPEKYEASFARQMETLHDYCITDMRLAGRDFAMKFEYVNNFPEAVFKKCTIVKLDADIIGAQWLYTDCFDVGGGYEIHALLHRNIYDGSDPLRELVIRAKEVKVNWKAISMKRYIREQEKRQSRQA